MARVLFISANTTWEPYPVFPLGLAMVANATQRAGHEVAIYDILAWTLWLTGGKAKAVSVEDAIRQVKPQVIGLSIRNIDNVDTTNLYNYQDDYIDLVKQIRRRTSSPVVLGGAGFSLMPEALMRVTGADYGIVGEGEIAFPALLDRIAKGDAEPTDRLLRAEDFGLIGGANLISPWDADEGGAFTGAPALTGVPVSPGAAALAGAPAFYLREGGMLNLQTKRGCPLQCAYCTYPALEGHTYRTRDPETIADEVEMLRDRHGADYLAFVDAVFNDQAGHYLEVAEALARRATGVRWMAFFRPTRMTAEETALLRRSGLSAVELGTDATTDATLEGLRKDFRWDDVRAAQEALSAAGIPTAHFVMFGGPGETPETIQQGLQNLDELKQCVVFAFAGVRILPHTALRDRAIVEGMLSPDDDLLESRFYVAPGLDISWIQDQLYRSFGYLRDRIFPASRENERAETLRAHGHHGPLWDMLLPDSASSAGAAGAEAKPRRRRK